MKINYLDIAAILILLFCVLRAKRRGVTYLVTTSIARIVSLVLSLSLYGPVASFLRQTPVFDFIAALIKDSISLDALPEGSVITQSFMANANNEIYKLFRVDTFADYISSYFANIVINFISVIIVYTVIKSIIRALFRMNRIVSGMPLMRGVNSLTGVLIGLIEGTLIIWVLEIILIFFVLNGDFLNIYSGLQDSKFAAYFLKYNILAGFIFKVTP